MEKKNKSIVEIVLGFALLVGALALGNAKLESPMLVFRLAMGIALGYTFARAYTGFAGSVNRAYRTGSTKLMRAMSVMFFVTAIGVTGLLVFNVQTPNAETGDLVNAYAAGVKPINLGLMLGGILFGFGMSLSSCCASGIMSDLAAEAPKAIITMFFFGLGVLLGMPMDTKSWVTDSAITLGEKNGVFLPDFFSGSPVMNYLGGLLLTGLIVLFVIIVSYKYEAHRKAKGTLGTVPSEALVENEAKVELPTDKKELGSYIYDKLFVNAWSVFTGGLVISVLFVTMFAATKGGWGASGPFGNWTAKVLMAVGIKADTIANYTQKPAEFFTGSIFANGIGIQNMGIGIGSFVYLLTSSKMGETAKGFFNVPKFQWFLFALGGVVMGFGTRMSNGCNAGALYTPAAQMSLSGWFFLIALIIGGVIGNKFSDFVFEKASK